MLFTEEHMLTSAHKVQCEEFRKYLEAHGVTESLSQALASLYLEKNFPEDPLDYIRNFLMQNRRPQGEVSHLRAEIRDLQDELQATHKEIEDLKLRLSKYEAVDDAEEESSAAQP